MQTCYVWLNARLNDDKTWYVQVLLYIMILPWLFYHNFSMPALNMLNDVMKMINTNVFMQYLLLPKFSVVQNNLTEIQGQICQNWNNIQK
jgi:hypothetical protein